MASYNANIQLNLVGQERLNKAITSLGQLKRLASGIGALSLTDGKLPDDIRKALKPFKELARNAVNTGESVKGTIARAQAAGEAFSVLASNVKVGSAEFKNFTIAAANQEKALKDLATAQENILRKQRGLQSVEERAAQLERRQNLLRVLRTRKRLKEEEAVAREKNARAIKREADAQARKNRLDQLAQKRRRLDIISSAVTGGAFPLLFGQGAGGALGGGIGGAAGAALGGQLGLGLSLAGSAFGAAVDTFVANVGELARSLGDPISTIQAFENAGFELDKTLKLNVEELLKAGDAYEAQRLVLEEVNRTMGPDAVGQMVAYDLEMKELNASYRELTARLQAALLPVLVGTINLINDLVSTFKILADSPLFGLLLKQARVMPGIGPAIGAFGALGERGRGLGRQQSGQFIPLDPSVRAAAEKVRQQRELKFQRELQRIEKNRIASQRKAQQDRRKVLQDLLELEKKINDVSLERIKEEGRRLERQKAAELQVRGTRVRQFESQMRLSDGLLGPKEAVAFKLKRLGQIKQEQDEIFRIERLQAEVEAQRNNPATLKFVVETYDRLAQIRHNEYEATRKTLEAEQARLSVLGTMASLSAAAGFQVSGELPGAFVPKGAAGILGPGAGLTGFITGAELAPIIQQEVALERVLEKYQEIGQAAQLTSELVTTGFVEMVSGTKTVEQTFAEFLNSLAEMLIKTAQQMIAQYIAIGVARMFAMGQSPSSFTSGIDMNKSFFGGGGLSFGDAIGLSGRANGGPVSGGTPYVVGERGPELFVPSRSGTVVPNNALGGNVNVVVNVTEGQTDTRGGSGQANQLGNAIAAAVQSELIKQKRPGGLLAS